MTTLSATCPQQATPGATVEVFLEMCATGFASAMGPTAFHVRNSIDTDSIKESDGRPVDVREAGEL
jgi:hypothetical protein